VREDRACWELIASIGLPDCAGASMLLQDHGKRSGQCRREEPSGSSGSQGPSAIPHVEISQAGLPALEQ
jgi:hypothetical protein